MLRKSLPTPLISEDSSLPLLQTQTLAAIEQTQLLAAIINASEDAILSKTLDGIITSWNPAAERIFGYTAAEIIGKSKTVLFPPERLHEEAAILERLQRGIATEHFETVRLHKNGAPLDVSVTISPIRNRDGQVIGASTIARDITERKQAEGKVKLLSTVAAESVNGIVITDPEQRILFVNPAYEQLTGYTFEELRGRRPSEVVQGPDTDSDTKQRVREALDAKQSVMTGLLNYHKNGTPYWIEIHITPVRDEQGEITHFIAIETDITHRKQAESALRQSHDRMSALIEAIPDIIFRVNREGICLDNLGRNKPYSLVRTEDAVGKPLRDFVPADVGNIVQGGVDAALATCATQSLQYQVSIDGITRYRDTRVVAQSEDVALVIVRDVTDAKAMEQALCESQARFQAFVNQSSLLAWITDSEGVVEYLNEPYCAMIGRMAEECAGKTVFDLYPAEIGQVMLDNIRQVAQTGETLETVETAPMPDGNLHHFLVHKFLLGEMNGRALVGGSAIDITQLIRAEEAVRQSQESLNSAQAMAHVGSWERDYSTDTMVWSDELFRLCGLEPGSITPSIQALTMYTHPLDRKRALESMKQAMESGKGARIEARFVGADGKLRHVFIRTEILKDAAGQPLGSRGTITDVSERVKALQEQTKFVSLIQNSSDFIAIASLDGVMMTMNPAGRKLVGLEPADEINSTMLSDFMPAEVWAWMQQGVLPIVMRDDRWEGECQLVNITTNGVYDMQASFFLIRNPVSGEPMCLATVQRDITEQKVQDAQLQQYLMLVQDQNVQLEVQQQELAAANTHLESLATTDGLTGAKNHRAFQEKLTEEFNRITRNHQPFSVILLDVDKFKQYNDTYGHPEGDRVLKQIVHVLQETARGTDFVARYGGEEFVILLPETEFEGAVQVAERFRAAIEAQDWPLRQVTASFGVATANALTESGQQLVEMADKALYVSKEGGRNRISHARTLQILA